MGNNFDEFGFGWVAVAVGKVFKLKLQVFKFVKDQTIVFGRFGGFGFRFG